MSSKILIDIAKIKEERKQYELNRELYKKRKLNLQTDTQIAHKQIIFDELKKFQSLLDEPLIPVDEYNVPSGLFIHNAKLYQHIWNALSAYRKTVTRKGQTNLKIANILNYSNYTSNELNSIALNLFHLMCVSEQYRSECLKILNVWTLKWVPNFFNICCAFENFGFSLRKLLTTHYFLPDNYTNTIRDLKYTYKRYESKTTSFVNTCNSDNLKDFLIYLKDVIQHLNEFELESLLIVLCKISLDVNCIQFKCLISELVCKCFDHLNHINTNKLLKTLYLMNKNSHYHCFFVNKILSPFNKKCEHLIVQLSYLYMCNLLFNKKSELIQTIESNSEMDEKIGKEKSDAIQLRSLLSRRNGKENLDFKKNKKKRNATQVSNASEELANEMEKSINTGSEINEKICSEEKKKHPIQSSKNSTKNLQTNLSPSACKTTKPLNRKEHVKSNSKSIKIENHPNQLNSSKDTNSQIQNLTILKTNLASPDKCTKTKKSKKNKHLNSNKKNKQERQLLELGTSEESIIKHKSTPTFSGALSTDNKSTNATERKILKRNKQFENEERKKLKKSTDVISYNDDVAGDTKSKNKWNESIITNKKEKNEKLNLEIKFDTIIKDQINIENISNKTLSRINETIDFEDKKENVILNNNEIVQECFNVGPKKRKYKQNPIDQTDGSPDLFRFNVKIKKENTVNNYKKMCKIKLNFNEFEEKSQYLLKKEDGLRIGGQSESEQSKHSKKETKEESDPREISREVKRVEIGNLNGIKNKMEKEERNQRTPMKKCIEHEIDEQKEPKLNSTSNKAKKEEKNQFKLSKNKSKEQTRERSPDLSNINFEKSIKTEPMIINHIDLNSNQTKEVLYKKQNRLDTKFEKLIKCETNENNSPEIIKTKAKKETKKEKPKKNLFELIEEFGNASKTINESSDVIELSDEVMNTAEQSIGSENMKKPSRKHKNDTTPNSKTPKETKSSSKQRNDSKSVDKSLNESNSSHKSTKSSSKHGNDTEPIDKSLNESNSSHKSTKSSSKHRNDTEPIDKSLNESNSSHKSTKSSSKHRNYTEPIDKSLNESNSSHKSTKSSSKHRNDTEPIDKSLNESNSSHKSTKSSSKHRNDTEPIDKSLNESNSSHKSTKSSSKHRNYTEPIDKSLNESNSNHKSTKSSSKHRNDTEPIDKSLNESNSSHKSTKSSSKHRNDTEPIDKSLNESKSSHENTKSSKNSKHRSGIDRIHETEDTIKSSNQSITSSDEIISGNKKINELVNISKSSHQSIKSTRKCRTESKPVNKSMDVIKSDNQDTKSSRGLVNKPKSNNTPVSNSDLNNTLNSIQDINEDAESTNKFDELIEDIECTEHEENEFDVNYMEIFNKRHKDNITFRSLYNILRSNLYKHLNSPLRIYRVINLVHKMVLVLGISELNMNVCKSIMSILSEIQKEYYGLEDIHKHLVCVHLQQYRTLWLMKINEIQYRLDRQKEECLTTMDEQEV